LSSDILRNKGAEKAGEILQQMWVLARIVLEGRKMTGGGGDASLNHFLDPRHFDNLVECAKNLGGFTDEDGKKKVEISINKC
jgi:hypothetical protein